MDSLTSSVASLASSTPATSVTSRRQKTKRQGYAFSTLCATIDNPDPQHRDQWGSSSVPIYQTATFKGMGGQYDYTRSGNPTRKFLENHVAKISNAKHAFAVSSGMGAMDTIFRMLQPGDEVIAGNDLYGGSNRLLTYLKKNNNVEVHHIDTTVPANFVPYVTRPDNKVKIVLLETPTNPLLQIADLTAIAEIVHSHAPNAVIVVDNTMLSPYLSRPLEHGADIVYDSATKYLSGHHDLMAGMITCDRDDLAQGIAHVINSVGNGLAPQDCFLLLRGIKTLALRMDKQQASAIQVAQYLDQLGFKVHFPGLPNHPGREIHFKTAKGPGAVLSFVTGDKALSERIVSATRLWGISVSFGCINSLISMPCLMSHASIDPKIRAERNLPEDLIRLCVGIEDTDDLIDDLEAALLEAGAIRTVEAADGEQLTERVIAPEDPAASLAEKTVAALPVHQGTPGTEPVSHLIVSAPGKVILFGEHAVVHGKTAIAGSVDLRCYCLVEPRQDDKVSLLLPDIDLDRVWSLDAIPAAPSTLPPLDQQPDANLLAQLQPLAQDKDSVLNRATLAFLYLYVCLAQRQHGHSFTVRSTLPIGAGLGSSAAYSVCIASALLYSNRQLPVPHEGEPRLHHGRRAIPVDHADLVNAWAFVAEKINHGMPSGIDNTCATYGGAVAYQKAKAGATGPHLESLHGFKSLKFLLVDTKVPRDTKSLVQHVGQLLAAQPAKIGRVIDAIHEVSEEGRRVLTDRELSRKAQLAVLESLIQENSALLDQLEVSHPSLETIRVKTAVEPYNLSSKLTGAGGGGCAVVLVPDHVSSDTLSQLKQELVSAGFGCYETSVGGSGLGLAVPSQAEDSDIQTAKGGAEAEQVPLRAKFEKATAEELGLFFKDHWVYV